LQPCKEIFLDFFSFNNCILFQLAENSKWNELLALRQSLQKLMPNDHPEFDLTTNPAKRGSTVDFNGIQVAIQNNNIWSDFSA
jgi:hypothetical protein